MCCICNLRYICNTYIMHMQRTCVGYATYMCCIRNIHVLHTQRTCVAYATYMWCICDVHVLHMQHTYVAYAMYMCCMCNVHVLHMRHTCVAYAMYMCCICNVRCICNTFFTKSDFFQKVPDEIFFNGWVLIRGQVDCAKLKRNLEWSKKRPGDS